MSIRSSRTEEARAARAPLAIKAQQVGARQVAAVGHVFLHRGLGDAVGDGLAIAQGKRLEQQRLGGLVEHFRDP